MELPYGTIKLNNKGSYFYVYVEYKILFFHLKTKMVYIINLLIFWESPNAHCNARFNKLICSCFSSYGTGI